MMITIIFSIIFALILILLVTGSYHRSVVAMLGALLIIAFGLEYGVFGTQDVVGFVFDNADTIALVVLSLIHI